MERNKCILKRFAIILPIVALILLPQYAVVDAQRADLVGVAPTVVAENVHMSPSLIQSSDEEYLVSYISYGHIFIYSSSDLVRWSLKSDISFNSTYPNSLQLYQDSHGKYWIVFSEDCGNYSFIGYITSEDAIHWSNVSYIFRDNTTINSNPTIAEAFGKMWVAWDTNAYRKDGDRMAIVVSHLESGVWTDPNLLFKHNAMDTDPFLLYANGKLQMVLSSDRYDNYSHYNEYEDQIENDILYSYSIDGLAWRDPRCVVKDVADSDHPSIIMTKDGNLLVFWDSNINEYVGKGYEKDIYYSKFTSGNWSEPTYLTVENGHETQPTAIQDTDGNYVLMYIKDDKLMVKKMRKLPLITQFKPDFEMDIGPWILGTKNVSQNHILSLHINQKAKRVVTIHNYGNFSLRGNIYTSGGRWLTVSKYYFELLPGESTRFWIRVSSDSTGDFNGYVRVVTNDETKDIPINVSVYDDGVKYEFITTPKYGESQMSLIVLTIISFCAIVAAIIFFKSKKRKGKGGKSEKIISIILIFIILFAGFNTSLSSVVAESSVKLIDEAVTPGTSNKIIHASLGGRIVPVNEEFNITINANVSLSNDTAESGALLEAVCYDPYGHEYYLGETTITQSGNISTLKYSFKPTMTGNYLVVLGLWDSQKTTLYDKYGDDDSEKGIMLFSSSNTHILSAGIVNPPPETKGRSYDVYFVNINGYPSHNYNDIKNELSGYSNIGGGFLGFGTTPGFGLEFDSYKNSYDPSQKHIALIKDTVENHLKYVNDSRVNDASFNAHQVKIVIEKSKITVYVDDMNNPLFNWTGYIDRTYGGFGFAAATGGANDWHYIGDVKIYDDKNNIIVEDDFTTDTGNWTYYGNAYRDRWEVVLTEDENNQLGMIWLNKEIRSDMTITFNYSAGWGSGGADGFVVMFYKMKPVDLGISFNYHEITTTEQLENLIHSDTENAIIINTHGNIIHVPFSYAKSIKSNPEVKALYKFEDPVIPFKEIIGVRDESPNFNDGKLKIKTDDAFSTNARFGNYSLDASKTFVEVPLQPSLKLQKFMVEFWVYPEDYGGGYYLATLVGTEGYSSEYPAMGWAFHFRNGYIPFGGEYYNNEITFSINDNGSRWVLLRSHSSISLNQWHKVTGIYDGSELKLLIDGETKDSIRISTHIVYGKDPLTIGGSTVFHDFNNRRFQGLIDEVSISTPTKNLNHIDNNLDFVSYLQDLKDFLERTDSMWINVGNPFSKIVVGNYYPGVDVIDTGDAGINAFLSTYGADSPIQISANIEITGWGKRLKSLIPSVDLPGSMQYSGYALSANYSNVVIPLYSDGNITPYGVFQIGGGLFGFAGDYNPGVIASMIFLKDYDIFNYFQKNRYKGDSIHLVNVIDNEEKSDVEVLYECLLTDPFSEEMVVKQLNITLKTGTNVVSLDFSVGADEPVGSYMVSISIKRLSDHTLLDLYGDSIWEIANLSFNVVNGLSIVSIITEYVDYTHTPVYEKPETNFGYEEPVGFKIKVKNRAFVSESFCFRGILRSSNGKTFKITDDKTRNIGPGSTGEFILIWNPNKEGKYAPLGDFLANIFLYDEHSIRYVNDKGNMTQIWSELSDSYAVEFRRGMWIQIMGYAESDYCEALGEYCSNTIDFSYATTDGYHVEYKYDYNNHIHEFQRFVYFMGGERIYIASYNDAGFIPSIKEADFEVWSNDANVYLITYKDHGVLDVVKHISGRDAYEYKFTDSPDGRMMCISIKLSPLDMGAYDWSDGVSFEYDSTESEAYYNTPNGQWVEYKFHNPSSGNFLRINVKSYNPTDHVANVRVQILDMNGNPVKDTLGIHEYLDFTIKFDERNGKYGVNYTHIYNLPAGDYLIKLSSADGNTVRIVSAWCVPTYLNFEYVMSNEATRADFKPGKGAPRARIGLNGITLEFPTIFLNMDFWDYAEVSILIGIGANRALDTSTGETRWVLYIIGVVAVTFLGSELSDNIQQPEYFRRARSTGMLQAKYGGIITITGEFYVGFYDFSSGRGTGKLTHVNIQGSFPIIAITYKEVLKVIDAVADDLGTEIDEALREAGIHISAGGGFYFVVRLIYDSPIFSEDVQWDLLFGIQYKEWMTVYYKIGFFDVTIFDLTFIATFLQLGLEWDNSVPYFVLKSSLYLGVDIIAIIHASISKSWTLVKIRVYW